MFKKVIIASYFFILRYLVALLYTLFLFTFGLLNKAHRSHIRDIAAFFGYRNPAPQAPPHAIVPCVRAQEFINETLSIKVHAPLSVSGNISTAELVIINHLIQTTRPGTVFEIGTFDGRTTLNIAANSPDATKIYTLDLPKHSQGSVKNPLASGEDIWVNKDTSGSTFYNKSESAKITQLYGDSASFDFSPYQNSIDFIFIDASHAYENVLADSITALTLLKNGTGTILWHDYNAWPGVTRALNEVSTTDVRFKNVQWIEGTSLVILRV